MRAILSTFLVLFLTMLPVRAAVSTVNVGASPNDATGDPLRTAFLKHNTNVLFLAATKLDNTNGHGYTLHFHNTNEVIGSLFVWTNLYVTNLVFVGGTLEIAGSTLFDSLTGNRAAYISAGKNLAASSITQAELESIPSKQDGSVSLSNFSGTKGITNLVNAATNGTEMITLLRSTNNGDALLKAISAGANVTITDNGTNLVIAAGEFGSGSVDFSAIPGFTNQGSVKFLTGRIDIEGSGSSMVFSNGASLVNSNAGFRRRVAYYDSNQKLQAATVANLTVDVTDTDLIALAGAQTVGNIATSIAGKVDENSGVLTNGQAWGAFDMWGVFTTHTDSHLANTVYLDSMVPDHALKITVGGTLGPAVPTGQELDWIAGLATNIMTLFNRKAEGQDSGATNFTVRVIKLPALTPNRAVYLDGNSNLATVVGYTGSEYVTGAGTLGVPAGSGETNPNGDAGNTNSTKVSLIHSKQGVTNFVKTSEVGYGMASTNQGTNIIHAVLPIFQPGDTKLTNIVGTGALTNLTVKEIDGAPNVGGVSTIRFSNATLTDDGGGQVTVTSGGAIPAGADWNFQVAGVGAVALAGATNSFYDPTNSRANFANVNVYSNLSVTPVALSQNGTNLVANGKLGSLFRAVLASAGSSGVSNLIVTNLNVGQPIEIEVFVPTGLQLNLLIEGGAAPPASWYLDQSAIALWTNGTSRIRIVNNGISTNIFIAGPTFAFIPGANTTLTTNFVTREISLASSGGGTTTGTNFDSTYLTNQALYIPTEYNGSNGTSAVAVTNNWDMRLATFRPVTNFVGTNLVFTLSNVTKSASLISEFIGIGGYSNTVLLQAVAGVNIKWKGWDTNANANGGGIRVRPGYSYTLQCFADRTTNVSAWVTTDDPTGAVAGGPTTSNNIPFTAYSMVTGSPTTNIVIDASLGTLFRVLLTNTASGLLITNGVDGQELGIVLYQDGVGNRTVTHVPNTGGAQTNNWQFGEDITSPIILTTNQYKKDLLKLRYEVQSLSTNTSQSNWMVIGGPLHKYPNP